MGPGPWDPSIPTVYPIFVTSRVPKIPIERPKGSY